MRFIPFARAGKYLAGALLIGTLVSGCGGGGGGNPTPDPTPSPVVSPTPVPTVQPTLTLHWGARSRATNAPASALSVQIVLMGVLSEGGGPVVTVNRADTAAEYTQTITLPNAVSVGSHIVNVNCYAARDAAGAIVATGQARVTIAADGTGIGDVALANTIRSVAVEPNQSVLIGAKVDPVVSCRDAAGALVAVTPGSIFLLVADGGDRLQVTDGQLEGLQPGTATVRATVDGITSAGTSVLVTSQAVVSVAPGSATVIAKKTQAFAATVSGAADTGVTWSVQEGSSGGSISASGVYQAPATVGTYHVVATSNYDPTKRAIATVTVLPAPPQTVYASNFEGAIGTEWSTQTTATTPVGARRFLGIFGRDAVTLTQTNLPPHSSLTVSFKLYLIRTWDGNLVSPVQGQVYGPDIWSLSVDGQSLLRTTFSNWEPGTFSPNVPQAFPANYGAGEYPGRQGASEKNTLGYAAAAPYPGPYQDSVYTLTYTLAHTASTANIQFSGLETLNGGAPGDEGWGIDDVQISVTE